MKAKTARQQSDLNAIRLKDELWATLKGVQDGSITPANADSVATQAREILRTVKTQLQILDQANIGVPIELIEFAIPKA